MQAPDGSATAHLGHLTTLLNVARQISATTDLDQLLVQIESAALDTLSCERVSIFLYDAQADELYSRVATGTGGIRFSAKKGIAGEALQTGSCITIQDAYADPRFNRAVDVTTGFRTRSLLTIPMRGHEGTPVAVLQLINKIDGTFTPADEQLADTLASLTGVMLQRQMLLDAYADKLRMERDLALAQEIQRSLLPDKDPKVDGFDIGGWSQAADETGGDFFDFIDLSEGRLGLVLADASGHGIGPALVAAECRALLRALAPTDFDIGTVMTRTNAILEQDLAPGRFITTFFGILDPKQASLIYVSGGQAPLLLYRSGTGERISLDATSLPLGIISFFDGSPAPPIQLDSGDLFVLLTDGFHEWANHDGDDFGVDRVFDVIESNQRASSQEMIRALHEAVVAFADGTPQTDDLTAIIIKKL